MRKFDLAAIDSKEAVLEASKDLKKLSELINERKAYWSATYEKLTAWLIKGSLVLTSQGSFAVFEPTAKIEYPEVIEWTSDTIEKGYTGVTTEGGDVSALPNIFSRCPSCNNKFTIEDVYNHNFQVVGNRLVHTGECAENFDYIYDSLEEAKKIILTVKRELGAIEGVTIKQRNGKKGDYVKIIFKAYGYKFEAKITSKFYIIITYKKDNNKIELYNDFLYGPCKETIPSALKRWKESL